jgi:hypothetical protein
VEERKEKETKRYENENLIKKSKRKCLLVNVIFLRSKIVKFRRTYIDVPEYGPTLYKTKRSSRNANVCYYIVYIFIEQCSNRENREKLEKLDKLVRPISLDCGILDWPRKKNYDKN